MNRIFVTYQFTGEDPKSIADVIRAEQTIEFPFELAPTWIQEEVVGKVEEISSTDKQNHLITISYNPDVTGGELNQFLNVLWGNVSLFPGIKIVDLKLPEQFLAKFKGPRFGISGLRGLIGAQTRPLVSTALKPKHLFIHFNGAYHSDEKEGILWYLNKYKPNLKILTISTVEQDKIDVLDPENFNKADFILVVPEKMTKTY